MRSTPAMLVGHRNTFRYLEIREDEEVEIVVRKKTGRFLDSHVQRGVHTLYLEWPRGSIEDQHDPDVQVIYSSGE